MVLFKGRGLYAVLIRLWNMLRHPVASLKYGLITHAAVVGSVGERSAQLYEALVSEGFVSRGYSLDRLRWLEEKGRIVIGRPAIETDGVEEVCEQMLGRGYAWRDIFGLLVGSKRLSTGARRLFCSEAVVRVLMRVSGRQWLSMEWFGERPEYVEPIDLRDTYSIKYEGDRRAAQAY